MKPKECKGCPLYEEGEGFVPGEGPKLADIVLVGEAPGAEEVRTGRPFVGGAGRVLNLLLYCAKLPRSECYVTNVVKCRPPNNRTPTTEEIAWCLSKHWKMPALFTLYDLKLVGGDLHKCSLLVPLGETALSAMTDGVVKGISKRRGFLWERSILPTFHPAFIMRKQDMLPVVVRDLEKAKRIARDGYIYVEPAYNLNPTPQQLYEFIETCGGFAFDIETTALKPEEGNIRCCGLCDKAGEAMCVPFEPPYIELLKRLFQKPILKVAHNVLFDVPWLEYHGFTVQPSLFDTMNAFHLTAPDLPVKLEFVASLYTNLPYWKHLDKENLELYNCYDVDATWRIYEALQEELHETELFELYHKSVNPLLPVIRGLNAGGIKVDRIKMKGHRMRLENDIEINQGKLRDIVGEHLEVYNHPGSVEEIWQRADKFNHNSPKQVAWFLYDVLKIPQQFHRKTGKVTTNEETLIQIQRKDPHDFIEVLLELRGYEKLASTYLKYELDPANRLYTEFLIHRTATGRLASRHPNLQNVPEKIRDIFVPSHDGWVFIEADYSQIEIRLAALMANEWRMLKAFAEGHDIHSEVAAAIFKIPVSEVTKEQRYRAKRVVHGVNYGRGYKSLAIEFGISDREARALIRMFFEAYPTLAEWRDNLVKEAYSKKYLATPFKRRRYFYGFNESAIKTEVWAFLPQSAAADMMIRSLIVLKETLPPPARIVLTVHDSILVECPEYMVPTIAAMMKSTMEAPFGELGGFSNPVSVAVGKNWGELKEI